jgi:histidyl-tRNA synthetase
MQKEIIPKIQTPKKNLDKSFALKEFDAPLLTAAYFGFTPIETPRIEKEDIAKQKTIKDPLADHPTTKAHFPFVFDVIEKAAILRTYVDWKWESLPPPILVAFKKPLPGGEHKKGSDYTLGLEILGLTNSSAEAILIRTALSILTDEGFENLSITLNSLGDKESVSDFEKMIGSFVRKNMNNLSADMRKAVKKDIFEIVRSEETKNEKLPGETPKSMSFLSESSRTHFKEVIEYVESFDIPYSINPKLIGSPTFCSHTMFEIRGGEHGDKILAQGYRYSRLSKKIGFKKEIAAIGATISFKKKEKGILTKGIPKMKFYMIQLSFTAKIKTLKALECLRKAHVFVAHSLAKDKLQSQLTSAENMKLPYMLLIGQKEAMEESVVVRDADTRVQESVNLKDLVQYLKKLK